MSLSISLRSEFLKMNRASTIYLCIIVAAIVPAILFFDTVFDDANQMKTFPWNRYFTKAHQALSIVFLPLYIILTCTLLLQNEYRNNTWKQVLTSPQKLVNVFFAKFIILHLLVLLFLISFNVWLAVEAVVVELIHPNLFNQGLNVSELLLFNYRAYVSIFAISAIQFWLALRFKNFIAPIAIGFCLWFLAPTMIFELKWLFADKYPYSFPILSLHPKYKASIPMFQWLSLGYAVLFLAIAFVEFKIRKVKG